MSDEAINRVAEITALPPAVAADLLVRTGGDPERVIQLYFDYEGDVPAVNAALMAGSANASVLDMLGTCTSALLIGWFSVPVFFFFFFFFFVCVCVCVCVVCASVCFCE